MEKISVSLWLFPYLLLALEKKESCLLQDFL